MSQMHSAEMFLVNRSIYAVKTYTTCLALLVQGGLHEIISIKYVRPYDFCSSFYLYVFGVDGMIKILRLIASALRYLFKREGSKAYVKRKEHDQRYINNDRKIGW